jgi:hypothetical protein
VVANFDELFEQMQKDELEDATKLTPIEYARLRGIRPQAVYRALRHHKLEWDRCECNRRVVVVEKADRLFNKGPHGPGADQTIQEEEEVPGQ